ncbi:hypothetical protein PSJE_06635 [Pseudomonas jessenii]|nr:hypothetical protein PSJE_06635 [Pseudomonas jessenii]
MVDNDNACFLNARGVLESIASKLAPTVLRRALCSRGDHRPDHRPGFCPQRQDPSRLENHGSLKRGSTCRSEPARDGR